MANSGVTKEALNCTASLYQPTALLSFLDAISFIRCIVLWSKNKFSPNPVPATWLDLNPVQLLILMPQLYIHTTILGGHELAMDDSRMFSAGSLTFLMFLSVLSVLLPLELFMYLCLIIGTLFLCISVHLTALLLSNHVLNLIILLLPITSSHSHASASDSTFDYWCYINLSLTLSLTLENKKAVLSQRWPRNAPYTWVPWKFRDSLTTPTATIPNIISRAFVQIDPMNVPTKFEVRSFISSWDNWGYQKNLGSRWIRPRSLFSQIFNRLLFRLAL